MSSQQKVMGHKGLGSASAFGPVERLGVCCTNALVASVFV